VTTRRPTLSFGLPSSATHESRSYALVPLALELADARLTVRQGVRGPRGRRPEVSHYLVQFDPPDPAGPHAGSYAAFLLLKSGRAESYRVLVSVRFRWLASCSCRGFLSHRSCKHADSLAHAVRVCGWGAPDVTRSQPAAAADPGPLAVAL
jgi:hypothetical protein